LPKYAVLLDTHIDKMKAHLMTRKYGLHKCLQFGVAGLLSWLSISLFTAKTLAQQSNIVPDNTLGAESSQVISNFGGLPREVITGGAIRQINLFHSFKEFNISDGREFLEKRRSDY
jgi:large exoprotein involved in heme utilization and adhesion